MQARLFAPRLLAAAGVLCMGLAGVAQDAKRYDGRTLDEWRALIQELDFKSPDRATAVPGLRAIVNDDDAPWFTRRQAALTLGRIGEPANEVVGDLVKLLGDLTPPVETSPPLWALKALSLFGPLAVEAAPESIRILKDLRAPIILRLTATETLGQIGLKSNAGVEALIGGASGRLETANPSDQLELRIACIEALQLGRPPSAVPMLIAACSDTAERIRQAAAATLGALGTHAEPAAESLGALVVFDESPIVRETAARSLARLGDRGVMVLERILLTSDDRDVLVDALDGAGRTVNRQQQLREPLMRLCESRDPLIAVRAMNAWWTAIRDPLPILNPLVRLLENDDREVRKIASDTLMRMGEAARPALPKLHQMERDGSDETQAAARRALRTLEERVARDPP